MINSEDIEKVVRQDLIDAFEGDVKAASKALRIAPSTLYGWPEKISYRQQCAVVVVCQLDGRTKLLARAIKKRT